MTIYDISLPISEQLPVWPGDPAPRVTQPLHLDRGDAMTLTRLEIGAHTGTHVDAPAHFIRAGRTSDALDLELLVGTALVVYAPDAEALSPEVLEGLGIAPDTERVLFRTRNSERWALGETRFFPDFVGIPEEGARWLVERGVALVGIDYLSAGPYRDPEPPHRVLLGAGVVVLEGLNLHGILPGVYQLVCLPLRIQGAEGAPARAILLKIPTPDKNQP